MKVSVRLGADPECVVECGGKPVSAIPLINGSKRKPLVGECGTHFSYDNVLAEFAITPSDSPEEFAVKIEHAKKSLANMLPTGHTIRAVASAVFDASELTSRAAKRFGCDPDYDAWTLSINRPPDPGDTGLRSCGGHIHIGESVGSGFLKDPYGKVDMIKALDSTLGMVLTAVGDRESELPRRNLYGRAGCHRPTSYGCEYRTPSCSWIENETMSLLVGNIATDAARLVAVKTPTAGLEESIVIDIINTCDTYRARDVVSSLIMRDIFSDVSKRLLMEVL